MTVPPVTYPPRLRVSRGLPVRVRVNRPAWALGVIALLLFFVARTSGAGWIVVLLAGIVAVLVIAVFMPLLRLLATRVSVASPSMLTVLLEGTVQLTVRAPYSGVLVTPLLPPGPTVAVRGHQSGEMAVVPHARGAFSHVVVAISDDGPLGLITWSFRRHILLPEYMEVAPGRTTDVARRAGSGANVDAFLVARGADQTRGARMYEPGDARRLVHWPQTARANTVMVRELDAPADTHLAVAVSLCGHAMYDDVVCAQAFTMLDDALRQGQTVELYVVWSPTSDAGVETHYVERSSPTKAPAVGRSLAHAVRGPVSAPSHVVVLTARPTSSESSR